MLTTNLQPTQQNSNGFIKPAYEADCISNLPQLALKLLHAQNSPKHTPLSHHLKTTDTKNANKIVLLVIDGFGFNQLLVHHKQNPFLTNLSENGDIAPITSVYPSQTTNALTTLNTGLTPQEHGLFEYFLYLKEVGVVNALRFERLVSRKKTKPVEEGFSPKLMFSGKSMHRTLKEQGINTYTHIHVSNASNACSQLIFDGSTVVPALKTSDLIVNLRKNLEKSGGGYFFVHIDTLDTISHEYGPESEQYTAEISTIGHLLQKELVEKTEAQTAKETLLLMTADHGLVQVNPEETTYLNLANKPLTNRQVDLSHKRIFPTGSPRDIFLHIKEKKLAQAKEQLTSQLKGKAEVVETAAAVKEGLFGLGKPSAQFLERTGNLLILPYKKETVWFANPEGRKLSFLGQHGGLNVDEMLVPFAVAKLDNLKKH